MAPSTDASRACLLVSQAGLSGAVSPPMHWISTAWGLGLYLGTDLYGRVLQEKQPPYSYSVPTYTPLVILEDTSVKAS